MCPRPTKPILVDVVVGISRPPFDRRNVILSQREVRRGDRVDLIARRKPAGPSSIEFAYAPANKARAASATPAFERRPELMPASSRPLNGSNFDPPASGRLTPKLVESRRSAWP